MGSPRRASVEYTYCADGDDIVIFRKAVGRMKREVYEAEIAKQRKKREEVIIKTPRS